MAKKEVQSEQRIGAKKTTSRGAGLGNGLKVFSLHTRDEASEPAIEAMRATRAVNLSFAFADAVGAMGIDAETTARNYLGQALASAATPGFTMPTADAVPSEFKCLGTESIPLTGTKIVKFRQTFSKIPVYGSLVTIELDEANHLLGINSALGTPSSVNAVAKISASDAVKAVRAYPGHSKKLKQVVPRLNYYFDALAAKWRLVFIFEDVPVVPDFKGPSPVLMDYVVDANSGKLVAALPRTPTLVMQGTGVDGLGNVRRFELDECGNAKVLTDSTLNVQTFDFKFNDPVRQADSLRGTPVKNPPNFPPAAISAHANAEAVAIFLRSVLKRNNIDNMGGVMRSSINCVDVSDSPDGKEWVNAFWNGAQMVYGQRYDGDGFRSMSVALDVVGHEMFHGVTDMTSRLEYALQPGALNESYSDIFGAIIANQQNVDPRTWQWQLGVSLQPNGAPFRDMSAPALHGQPDHMRDFKVLPNTRNGDNGGVHRNSGIHNKAAFNILTAVRGGALVFTPTEVATCFYLAITQRLSRTSQFTDSCIAVLDSARTLFRNLTPTAFAQNISVIE